MRLIDADAIRKKYKHELTRTYLDDYAKGFQSGLNAATGEHAPVIDAVSVVRHGRWMLAIEDWNRWTCSVCGWSKRTDSHVSLGYNYCPHCGAKMDGGDER